jgi:pimeloyl-ACP methyl ester carboxylesterase
MGRAVDELNPHAGLPVPGKVESRSLDARGNQRYFLYRPARACGKAPLLVSVHGISRNARAHATCLARVAEQHGVVVVAPLFTTRRFHDYQRMGHSRRGERPDRALNEIVAEAGRLSGADVGRFFLFGYSGGAQFAHRYAMAYPQRIAGLALSSAGWYTFPDSDKRYPWGMRASTGLPDLCFDLDRFLELRIHLFVGGLDTLRGPDLNRSRRIDMQQGATRLERAVHWAAALRRAALLAGKSAEVSLCTLPRSGHCFEENVARDRLDQHLFEAFFGDRDKKMLSVAPGAEREPAEA